MFRKAYSIYSPPFETTSGGIRVMYGLYGWLLAKGEIAFLNAKFDNPDQCVAIYPEIARDNPIGASTVVRYILQTPGIMSSYGVPSPTTQEYKNDPIYKKDKFYIFSKIYDTFGVDDDHIMFLPIINTKVFKVTSNKRHKTAYLVGKGVNQHCHPSSAIEITREYAQNQQALADLLNHCHTLYVYDRLSAIMEIARLCGSKVKYYGEMPLSELEKYEPGMNGLGYMGEERSLVISEFRDHYLGLRETFEKKLDLLIEETQS